MRRPWTQLTVVFLLLTFLMGEAGISAAAGLLHCDGCCGCCDRSRHAAVNERQAMGGSHHHPAPADTGRIHEAGQSCCGPMVMTNCNVEEADKVALLSSILRLDRQLAPSSRISAIVTPSTVPRGGGMATDPFTAAVLARSTLPIYLRTAVFLC